MLLATTLLALAGAPAPAAAPVVPTAVQDRDARRAVRDGYQACAETGDEGAMTALWRANPGLALRTIDGDLEGFLAKWEEATAGGGRPTPEVAAEIAAMQARALFGARCAAEALDAPIVLDYTSSFIGWTPAERADFRAGQAAFGRAMSAANEGKPEEALAAALECIDLALPLGDWWGAAMGHGAAGGAYQALGNHPKALAHLSQARLLNDAMGFRSSEEGNLSGMLDSLVALERWPRALVVAESLEGAGDEQLRTKALESKALALDGLGRPDEAAAVRALLTPPTPDETMTAAQPATAWTDQPIETIERAGGLVIEVFERGTGALTQATQNIEVHYRGWCKDTTKEFDSSFARNAPFAFRPASKRVIQGWYEGVVDLPIGSRVRLHIPWAMAYGAAGRPPVIPAKADLVFDVQILGAS